MRYIASGLVIEIALNNYGFKQIRRLNYEQVKALRRKYDCLLLHFKYISSK